MNLKNKIILTFSLLGVTLLLSTCKKYPESNLWFKNPKKIGFMEGHLTHYIVNGVDSIDFLDNFFYNDFNDNPYIHKFSDLEVKSDVIGKGYYEVSFVKPADYIYPQDIIDSREYHYLEGGKKIKISGTKYILNTFKKNIFINDDIAWEIIYLKRKNDKRIMKGTYNGNTYELQFN